MNSEKKLKILAYVHGYFPNHNAGAEAMLHQILIDLKNKGHEVAVLTGNPGADEYEGVPIYQAQTSKELELLRWSDIIFTHLDFTRIAVAHGKRHRKPVVHLVHNDKQLPYNRITSAESCVLAIANSDWIRKTIKRSIPSTIVFPPTRPDRYAVESSRETITLINMNEGKGGRIFWELARIFPDREFLGVRGAYGEQLEYKAELPNVTILDNSPDVKQVYSKSRIVIMPSAYESWGRVAMEASCSGIPVIASPTPGLKESLSYAGIFAEFDSVADWVDAIRMLDDKKIYEKFSKLTKKRSLEVDKEFAIQMADLEQRLIGIIYKD